MHMYQVINLCQIYATIFNTRTGRGGQNLPSLLFLCVNNSKTAARSAAKVSVPSYNGITRFV